MRILVTGATGFLGSHLCRELVRRDYQVTALRRESSNLQHLGELDLEFRTADLTDTGSLGHAVAGQDAVIHAAAEIRYAADQGLQQRTNVDGTRALAGACREHRVGRLVHVSSVAAIGIPSRGVIADETFPFNLEGSGLDYHLSKKRAEESVLEEFRRGLPVVIVNPGSIFGPHGRSFRGGDMIYKVRRSTAVPYFVGGICAVHVGDVVAGILSALERGEAGERYILGGENLTYKDLAQRSAAGFGLRRHFLPVLPVITTAAHLLVPGFSYARHFTGSRLQFYSSAKAQHRFGYRPRPFAAILDECLRFRGEAHSAPAVRSRSSS